ncbi:MAG: 30S ribosomal protein S16 [Candidatus Omnitrophica bacterium]|nr:30S ribosomal protein S16 [Candidatus Omnitrophota bacterium]MBU1047817.1 30S ribosomal protein S16 [Candidatus Omnitrophota bacterium]MBU1631204.1 30S ribosomal protein S16 [Candidatus Omnitrophota bacterium]MBU1767212.1 30S ribosomal protein S16 [Candidatus Omnitrophota bacterium]MBU1888652.1 30S ribosomal protein S16 [Candidatus Omnitrophota bacterium]
MAIRIRLKRIGKKKQSYYRIVVADVRFPRDGRSIEEIGLYDPNQDPAKVDINKERLEYWMGNGATLTPTVENILKSRPKLK